MDNIMYIIIPILVFLVFTFLFNANKKSEKIMDENNFILRQPKLVLWIGIICTLFFSALIVLMSIFPNNTAEWWVYLIFSLFVILGFFLIFHCIRWELKIEVNQIIYTPFIGGKRLFTIDNIKRVKLENGQKIIAYDGNKKLFSVEYQCNGFNVLVSRLRKEQIPFEE
jgi:hypothetical protein